MIVLTLLLSWSILSLPTQSLQTCLIIALDSTDYWEFLNFLSLTEIEKFQR